jgi:hypothetical protein
MAENGDVFSPKTRGQKQRQTTAQESVVSKALIAALPTLRGTH